MRTNEKTLGSLLMVCILGFGLVPTRAAAQDNAVDSKLLQYVRDAKNLGGKSSSPTEGDQSGVARCGGQPGRRLRVRNIASCARFHPRCGGARDLRESLGRGTECDCIRSE